MRNLYNQLVIEVEWIKKTLGFLEVPILAILGCVDLLFTLADKPFKKHAYLHWLSSVLLKTLFVGVAIATTTTLILGAALAFPILYLSLTAIDLVIKIKGLYTEYSTKKADLDPVQTAKRRKHQWCEIGLKIAGCITLGLLLFLPGPREAFGIMLIAIGVISLISAITRPKRKVDWSKLAAKNQTTSTPTKQEPESTDKLAPLQNPALTPQHAATSYIDQQGENSTFPANTPFMPQQNFR
jgi:hypothetical protein